MSVQNAQETVDEVFSLYDRFGAEDYIGEPVSQIEHMSQSADLAMREGFENEVVLAAFFHDIGHICVMHTRENSMGGFGVKSHEKMGADFLRSKGFPERIARLVENHVEAKRYLTYKNPVYFEQLSAASKKTLVFQGGPMTQSEAEAFERDPLFEASVRLRQWDEMAKEMNVPITDLSRIKAMAFEVLVAAPAIL
jgi:phosphonate degradation associated HDIG domain protein